MASAPVPPLVAAVELGGTKIVCGVATAEDPTRLLRIGRFPTTHPVTTLARIDAFLGAASELGPVTAIGVASFGPLNVVPGRPRYAWITDTPKHGWSDTSLLEGIPALRTHPIVVMTDVSAAAFAEYRFGAAAGTRNAAYLTVGTGIGAGLVVHGSVLHGDGFPEAGHLLVRRHPDDAFVGCCPQHGDCAEGLAAGPAVLGRWGVPGAELDDPQRAQAADILGYYVAQVVHAVHGIAGPERVVLGGGVMNLPGLFAAVGTHLRALRTAPDPVERGPELVRPVFEDAGLIGALAAAAELGA